MTTDGLRSHSQDPMAELVRVDPKSLGVGLYQHDLPPKLLDAELAQESFHADCDC